MTIIASTSLPPAVWYLAGLAIALLIGYTIGYLCGRADGKPS